MKVAISATGGSLSAMVDERFGRAPYFVFVDSEGKGFTALSNPSINATSGAGPQTAMLLKNNGAEVVLTGRVGPNARRALEAAGIKVVEGVQGVVKEALEDWLKKQG